MRAEVRTFTFLFTDIEGSTRLWQNAPGSMSASLKRHDELIASVVAASDGQLVKSGSRGDSALAAFARASDAIACAVRLQQAFRAETWDPAAPLRIRSALHTGEAECRDCDYFGPTLNRAARLLSVAHGGQSIVSAATAEAVKDSTPEGIELLDLGEHVLKDIVRPERIAQIIAPGLTETFPPLGSVDRIRHRLPEQTTSFVGRNTELSQIADLLASSRIVTLTGIGGTGKTRLALAAAAEQRDRYREGAAFIDLAPVRDPTTVARTLVSALDVMDPAAESPTDDAKAASDRLTSHLARTLRDHELLLVIDNCEHVVDATCRLVTALLASCPDLRVLATSREPIGAIGEHVYVVPPLAPPREVDDPSVLEKVESVRLFCDRARAVRSDFELNAENAPSVTEICARLDGIPLAVELAAARVRSMSPAQILERLGTSPGLLSTTARGGVERHRTLEGTLEWSHETFEDDERILFRRLAVFNGGWTLEDAESVCAHDGLAGADLLDVLTRLVDRSFVVAGPTTTGRARYRLLEPVRQFAERKLAAAGEEDAAHDRHVRHFVGNVGDESFSLYVDEGRLAELMPDIDNYRAAMRWAIDSGDADAAMRIASGLNSLFGWMGHRSEADRWLADALSIGDATVTDLRASTIGTLAANQDVGGDMRRAVDLQREAASMFEELGNEVSLCWSLLYVGHGLHFREENDERDVAYRRALDLAEAAGIDAARSLIPFLQSWGCFEAGDLEAARERARAVLAAGDGHAGAPLAARAMIALCDYIEGDAEAIRICDELVERILADFVDAAGNEDPMGPAFMYIVARTEIVDPATTERGRRRMADCIRRSRRTGLLWAQSSCLEHAAALAQIEGRTFEAARLFGGAEGLRDRCGIEMRHVPTKAWVDVHRAAARSALGESAFDAAFDEGALAPFGEILDLAQAVLEPA